MILEEGPYIQVQYLPLSTTRLSVEMSHAASPALSSSPAASWQTLTSGRYLPLLEIPEQGTSLEEIEKELVQLALQQTRGNQTRAARLLDISRDALRYRIKKFGLGEDEPYTNNGLAG